MKNTQETLGGLPTGRTTDAFGQLPEGVLVLNPRNERVIAWLIYEMGFEAVQRCLLTPCGTQTSLSQQSCQNSWPNDSRGGIQHTCAGRLGMHSGTPQTVFRVALMSVKQS